MASASLSGCLVAYLLYFASFCHVGTAARRHQRETSSNNAPVATVKNGSYEGVYSAGYDQDFFLGMPYATPPERFTVSQHLDEAWYGTRDAKAYPPHCVGYGGDDIGYELSEDCLYLNVIRPHGIDTKAGLPVGVWIHGGGLFMGGSADKRYNMTFIVQNSVEMGTPVIGVSLNYRLHAFGFPSGEEIRAAGATNLGFRDQRLALNWVRENIAAFGGDPDAVTIFGESSGAESVSAQVLAYNGRDDKLFRAAIGESGFGGALARFPGGFNATQIEQFMYDTVVSNTSCGGGDSGTPTLDCLRALPFEELNAALNASGTTWPPLLDGDFIADYPTTQLREGRFPRVPILIGCNADEGTAFGSGRGPNGGGVNTDEEFAEAVGGQMGVIGMDVQNTTGRSPEELVRELMYLYPNIQAVGEPGLDNFPVLVEGSELAQSVGMQYRRTGALFGDQVMHYLRRRANIAWSEHDVPSYSYNFDITVNGIPDYVAATHFQEVAFVFYNLDGLGYDVNPFGDDKGLRTVAKAMSTAWINFFVGLDPNGEEGSSWPVYDPAKGGGVGENLVWTKDGSHVEVDSWRAEGINWMIENALAVFGN